MVVRVHDVAMTYGNSVTGCQALRGVSLEVRSGELVGLMGPSGSGKTTLLSIIAGLLRPTRGSVQILGQELASLNAHGLAAFRLAKVGILFQDCKLFPALTARENVAVALELKDRPTDDALRLLDQVGLSDKLHTFPAQLSGGQKQRVAIARALAGDPALMLADEPTAALDSRSGKTVMELIRQVVCGERRAGIVVSHDPSVLNFADRVEIIADGVIAS